jgi:hypothetical protein
MDEATDLRNSSHWRLAVWGLRVMGPGLAVVAAGLITLLVSTVAGQAILVVGMCVYLIGVVITVTGIILVYHEVPPPRPIIIWLRWSLLHDAPQAGRSATCISRPERGVPFLSSGPDSGGAKIPRAREVGTSPVTR